jgi:hypothetical protein
MVLLAWYSSEADAAHPGVMSFRTYDVRRNFLSVNTQISATLRSSGRTKLAILAAPEWILPCWMRYIHAEPDQ